MDDPFYDALAPFNHLLFARWQDFQAWQFEKISAFLPPAAPDVRVIDLACGIGTQMLPLAAGGYMVCGIDSSSVSVRRSQYELSARGLPGIVRNADLRDPNLDPSLFGGLFDAALLLDNYISHSISDEEVLAVMQAARRSLKLGGTALLGLRDYDEAAATPPTGTPPAFYRDASGSRIVHQIWDWRDASRYQFHLHIAVEVGDRDWMVHHFVGHLRPVPRARLVEIALAAGFGDVKLFAPSETGYHQWLLKLIA